MHVLKVYFCIFCIFWGLSCKSYIEKIQDAEVAFFHGKFDTAVSLIRPIVKDSASKDKLLYLLETGIIFHTQEQYEKSLTVFLEADSFSEEIKKSITKEILAFIVNDTQKNFIGENYERVLIKFYIALNYIMLGKYEDALIYFRKMNFDLKDMKNFDEGYKQNLMGRYLQAILAEYLKSYNETRVEYKNIEQYGHQDFVAGDRYVLAIKENDKDDTARYKKNADRLIALNKKGQLIPYNPNLGELIFIHQAGSSAVKASRGNLLDDEAFEVSLVAAIGVAILAQGAAITVASVMPLLWSAQNPIPFYEYRTNNTSWNIDFLVNKRNIGSTFVLNDYSLTAIKNYNDHYDALVGKNIASIATKAVTVAVASNVVGYAVENSQGGGVGMLVGAISGTTAGVAVGATIQPDLRCWRFIPSNFQVKRIFLEPGEYNIDLQPDANTRILTQNIPDKVKIEVGKPTFINIRTF